MIIVIGYWSRRRGVEAPDARSKLYGYVQTLNKLPYVTYTLLLQHMAGRLKGKCYYLPLGTYANNCIMLSEANFLKRFQHRNLVTH